MRYLSKILHIICQDSSLRPPPEQDGSELTQEPAQENRLKRLFTILEKRTERETIKFNYKVRTTFKMHISIDINHCIAPPLKKV